MHLPNVLNWTDHHKTMSTCYLLKQDRWWASTALLCEITDDSSVFFFPLAKVRKSPLPQKITLFGKPTVTHENSKLQILIGGNDLLQTDPNTKSRHCQRSKKYWSQSNLWNMHSKFVLSGMLSLKYALFCLRNMRINQTLKSWKEKETIQRKQRYCKTRVCVLFWAVFRCGIRKI